ATPDAPTAENVCYRMDLAHAGRGWEVCAPLPGEGRLLAVLGTATAALYVFSGVVLREGQRQYLTDSYRFDPAAGWKKLPDLPRAVAAAPSPCFFDRPSNRFFIFGGVHGGLAQQQLGAAHPGFSRCVPMFDVDAGEWDHQQVMDLHGSFPPAWTTAVVDETTVILPMGEIKPVIRTSHISLHDPIVREFALTDAQFGLLTTIFLVAYGLFSPLGGYLADKYARKTLIVFSVLVWSLTTIWTGYCRSFEEMLISRFLMGVSEACYIPAGLATLTDYHRGRSRSLATCLHMSGLYAGMAL